MYICMYMFGKVRNNGAVQFWSRKGKEEKETEKARILCKRLKRMEVTFYFYFYFFSLLRKEIFHPRIKQARGGASVLENVNVQINFLIKDLLLW